MTPWSAFTCVSRWNELTKKAIMSVAAAEPDEYVLYLDTQVLEVSEIVKLIEWLVSDPLTSEIETRYMVNTRPELHYDDVQRQFIEAILEAKHPWVLNCDDDDELIGEVQDLLKHTEIFNGFIYGHRFKKRPDGAEFDLGNGVRGALKMELSRDVHHHKNMAFARGSVIMYNREAVRQVHKNMDVYLEERLPGHCYWFDYLLMYWLMRAGFKAVSCGEVISITNMNLERSEDRVEGGGKWTRISMELDLMRFKSNLLEESS